MHAFSDAQKITESLNRNTVYTGDTVNVSLAVDKPNKLEDNSELQYNLGGFTVKMYFGTCYFEFVDEETEPRSAIEFDFVANSWGNNDIEDGTGDNIGSSTVILMESLRFQKSVKSRICSTYIQIYRN